MAKEKRKSGRKPSDDGSKEYAFYLYMAKVPQKDIAERVGVTEKTITTWKTTEGWEAKRGAKAISMDELVRKALLRINELLDQEEFNADGFSKAVNQLKALKTGITVDDLITALMDFQNHLIENRIAENLTEEFIKQHVKLQDAYIQLKLGGGHG